MRTRGTSRAPSFRTGRRATLRLALAGDLIEAHLGVSPQKILGASLDSSEFCTLFALCPFGLGRFGSVGDLDFRPNVRVAGYSELLHQELYELLPLISSRVPAVLGDFIRMARGR